MTNAADRDFIEQSFGYSFCRKGTIRAQPGLDAVGTFQKNGSWLGVKAVWIIGTNPVASMPNRARVIAGFLTCGTLRHRAGRVSSDRNFALRRHFATGRVVGRGRRHDGKLWNAT